MAKYIFPTLLTTFSLSLLSGCVTQSYENNEPIVKTQANRDEMAATRVSLGLGYLKMGDMSQAKLNLEKAKRFSPNLVQVHAAFAHYYETVGEETLAVDSFEQALTIKADSADTLNNYGVFLCRQGKVEAAEAQFLKAIAVPSYLLVSQSYENLASCYLQNDNFEKAEMYLDKAISHSPNRTATLLQMVRLQYAMGDYKQAKSFEQRFEKVTRRFTSQSLALAYKVHFKLGQRKTAKNYGAMLVKMYPQSWEAQQYILNELELIEADNLAKRYQLSQATNTETKPKKRIVKLSPKKVNTVTAEPKTATHAQAQKQIVVAAVIVEKETNKTDLSTVQSTTAPAVNSGEKKTIVKLPNKESNQEKRTLVVNSPKTEKAKAIEMKAEEVTAENIKTVIEESKLAEKEHPQKFPDFHVVKKGDTLYNISVKYNIKLKALRRWNKISKNQKIHIKDIIFLENPKSVNQ